MVHKYGPETSHEERANRRMQIVYAGKMRERQIFMEELKEYRKQKDKIVFNNIKKSIGPIWYQALSVPQRTALDALEFSIYQDLLEGRPVRTAKLMRELGLYPRPNNIDLMNCLYLGRDDPKVMLAQLFAMTYGHNIDGKRGSYCLNARLMLSGILYLGLDNLITLLKERFRPDQQEKPKAPKPKPKPEPPLASPYLQKMIAVLYEPPTKKRPRPAPLPNLDDLNEPYEEEPPIPKPPPPPPPPPPPKKRLPRSYCDKLAGVMNIEPYSSITTLAMKTVTRTSHRRMRGSKLCVTEVKKTYGISVTNRKKSVRRRKPVAPSTGMWNSQYVITGVYQVLGKSVFVLGSVSILPPIGELIHGGYRYLNGEYINIHCGFRARPPPPKPDPCDCVKKWQDQVFEYVKGSKCYCEHFYDYGNEGTFPIDDLQFFQKPTKHMPFKFNYETIYDLDQKRLHVEREFKKLWDTDSMLHVDDGTVKDKKDKKKKKTKRSSTTCLGQNPKPEDYLKCALRLMRRVNVAARLPDIHLVPELKEWMRQRINGPYTVSQKSEMIRKSTMYWQMFQLLDSKGYGHVSPPKDPTYSGHTTWVHKLDLNEKFKKYTYKYRLALFRSLARVNNLMWPTMYQAQFPDKKFREIYFSYLFGRIEDLQIMHPYSTKETAERKFNLARKRYCCLPAGIEPQE
ncbi:uncharacterized protein LOC114365358 [Ostrinia furnacalis]|uniref:uncharacterized protein LOC114365358 n=1 Tax=Ostrinia furnacalis TaxID=93504 RepID=UPI00103DCDD9|nr:uncharacterized protein LOC114365358 [Ostrinia furnacalis]